MTTTASPAGELDRRWRSMASTSERGRASSPARTSGRPGTPEQRHGRRRHARKRRGALPPSACARTPATRSVRGWLPMHVPFGVYVHIPFCATRCDYCDFATWTDRHHLIDDYVDACVRDVAAPRAPVRPPACSSAAGRRRCSPPGTLARILDAIDVAAGAEVTVECNPDSVDAGQARRLRGRGRQPGVVRRAVDAGRTCSPRSAAPTTPPTSRARSRWARDAGIRARQPRPHLRHAGRVASTTGAPRSTRALALEPDARERVRAHRRARHAARAGGRGGRPARARRRRPGRRSTRSPTTASRAAGLRVVRDLELGAPRRGVPPQPPLLGAGRRTSRSAARPTATRRPRRVARRWWNVRTPERYVAAVGAGRDRRGGRRGARPATPGRPSALALALRTRAGIKLDAPDADLLRWTPCIDDARAAGLARARDGDRVVAHPPRAGSWPRTRPPRAAGSTRGVRRRPHPDRRHRAPAGTR